MAGGVDGALVRADEFSKCLISLRERKCAFREIDFSIGTQGELSEFSLFTKARQGVVRDSELRTKVTLIVI